MSSIGHGTTDYIGGIAIKTTSILFVTFIYPVFIFYFFYDPSIVRNYLTTCVLLYAAVVIIGNIVDKFVGRAFKNQY